MNSEKKIEILKKEYMKYMRIGLVLMLIAFLLMIFKPFSPMASYVIAIVVFLLAFLPLEMARRISHRMALIAFRERQ
ncbi:hypothetical protein [Thermococcus sp.]